MVYVISKGNQEAYQKKSPTYSGWGFYLLRKTLI
jgi:hypothetical protein|tara:strand:+ start:66064 stop:66165 length:102 start_codon:yes stop_codon:yes gene_type:complete